MSSGLVTTVLVPLHAAPGDDIRPLEGWAFVTEWTFQLVPFVLLLISAWLYLRGVRILRRRGDRWPLARTLCFVVGGLGSIAVATFSFLGAYDTVLFWVHMVQHMLLTMVAPVFLTLGAPVTLALRALPKRPRGWLLAVLHSTFAKILLFPPLTTLLVVATPFLLYMSGLYDLTLRNDLLHDLLHVWLLFTGCLFFVPMLAVDPVPVKMPYPIRMLLFMLTMPFHAFLGVTIMGSSRLIAEEWYLSFDRSWGLSPYDDQTWAGALMWATGDLTILVTMGALFVQWVRDSQKEARRADRIADREEAARARAAAADGQATPETDAVESSSARPVAR